MLFDDRLEAPGVKFNDADLIGLPLRVVVSSRSLRAGGVEVKRRAERQPELVPASGAVGRLREMLAEMSGG